MRRKKSIIYSKSQPTFQLSDRTRTLLIWNYQPPLSPAASTRRALKCSLWPQTTVSSKVSAALKGRCLSWPLLPRQVLWTTASKFQRSDTTWARNVWHQSIRKANDSCALLSVISALGSIQRPAIESCTSSLTSRCSQPLTSWFSMVKSLRAERHSTRSLVD